MVRKDVQELDIESAVKARYSGAALAREPELCCPVSYDAALLAALPEEVLARDYGCGDPSRHLRPGETVLDLGSGTGKVCFIASQVVRPSGWVIGIDSGRIVISDIVSDEDVPLELQRDADLWSGCISRAFREDRFLEAFEEAGFYGISVLARGVDPWRIVQGMEFRSVTVAAWKGKQGPCFDHRQAVIYRGPFREVVDDDGHVLSETKGDGYDVTTEAAPIVCPPGGDCC